MSVSPPPGPASGRIWIGDTTWKLFPPSVDLCTNEFCVVVPHGPDSHQVPCASRKSSGSPSVRCASTIVDGPKTALQRVYVGIGVIPFEPGIEPGGSGVDWLGGVETPADPGGSTERTARAHGG